MMVSTDGNPINWCNALVPIWFNKLQKNFKKNLSEILDLDIILTASTLK